MTLNHGASDLVLDVASESVEMRMIRDFLNFMARPSTRKVTGVDVIDWLPENVIEWAEAMHAEVPK